MIVNVKKFRKMMKEQYKSEAGLTVGMSEERLYLSGTGWELDVIMTNCCKEIKAQVIELLGFIPVYGEMYCVSKDETQQLLYEDVGVDIKYYEDMGQEFKTESLLIKPTFSTSKGTRLFVTDNGEVFGLDERFVDLLGKPDLEETEQIILKGQYHDGTIIMASTYCRIRFLDSYVPENIRMSLAKMKDE